MFIDGHRHIGFAGSFGGICSVEEVLQDMQELQIDRTVVLPMNEPAIGKEERNAYVESVDEANLCFIKKGIVSEKLKEMRRQREDHREICAHVRAHPDKLIGVFMVNPWLGKPMLDEAEQAITEWGFGGLKLHPCVNGYPADHEITNPVLELARKHNIPVMFHTSFGHGTGPKRIGQVAQRFSDIRIVLYHAANDWCGNPRTDDAIDMANKHGNIWIDLADAGAASVQAVINRAPANRIVFGSDNPFGNLRSQLKLTNNALGSHESDRKLIFGKNMAQVLNLM